MEMRHLHLHYIYQRFCHVNVNSLIIEELWNESTWLHPICLDVETQDSGY